ncbi:hypothetical protein HanPSC8_Chr09g0361431 [Helianthus annuus]|nr:hypothetical protein HanPSC8_Chr09g0361431 [Helianthus annuus]
MQRFRAKKAFFRSLHRFIASSALQARFFKPRLPASFSTIIG